MTHYVPLCNFANSFLDDRKASEDAVQEVFLHLWKNNDKLNVKDSIENLLFASVRNKAFELKRSKKAYKNILEDYHQNNQWTNLR